MLRVHTTLSRPFTRKKDMSTIWLLPFVSSRAHHDRVLTVVSSDDRMMVRSRLNNDFDLWVLTSECGKIFLNVVTGRSSFMSGSSRVALSIQ